MAETCGEFDKVLAGWMEKAEKDECPECGYWRLHGPVSDFWGRTCPDCGWEEEEEAEC